MAILSTNTLVFVSAILVITHLPAVSSQDNVPTGQSPYCPINEGFVTCATCEPTCTNQRPACPLVCPTNGTQCTCLPNFYRSESTNSCISWQECNTPVQCPRNEVYTDCGGCEGTCNNTNPICTLQCRPAGCYCPVGTGFVRGPKGHCISASLCGRRLNPSNSSRRSTRQTFPSPTGSTGNQTCGQNEALVSCPGCEPTCENVNPICPMICREGQKCQCVSGYVRERTTGLCIEPNQCPPLSYYNDYAFTTDATNYDDNLVQ